MTSKLLGIKRLTFEFDHDYLMNMLTY